MEKNKKDKKKYTGYLLSQIGFLVIVLKNSWLHLTNLDKLLKPSIMENLINVGMMLIF
jgi:hypothetical protein